MSEATPMLTIKELAAHLLIGRKAVRKLMGDTRGVITLATLNGDDKDITRRMPEAVYHNRFVQRVKKGK